MIVERTESPDWTSNAYLVADREGGRGVLIDGNGQVEPLITRARELELEIAAVIVTHWHHDHIAGIDRYREAFAVPVYAHPWTEQALDGDVRIDRSLDEGDVLDVGDLRIEAWHTPGHTAGQLSLLVNGTDVFTADVLFKGTVGGTFAPGNTGFADHRASVMRLMELEDDVRVHPGHTLPTTIGDEREHNGFVRLWRGVDQEGTEPVVVWDRPATLILWAPDYDGTNKAWVRFDDDGADGIVGGSQVVRGSGAGSTS